MKDWLETTLHNRISIKHGFPFKSEYFASEGDYIVLTPGNFYEEGGFKRQDGKEKFYTGTFLKPYLLSKGDLIVAMTEQAEGLLGSMAIIPSDNLYLHNQRIGLVTVDENKIDKLFLYHLFKAEYVRRQIRGSASGTKVKHTSPERIYDVKAYFPPVEYQKKIADVFSTLDAKIELNNRINAELESLAKTIYDYWFVQFDFPDDRGNPYKSSGGKMVYNKEIDRAIPADWEVRELGEFGSFKNGVNYDPSQPGDIHAKIINVRDISKSSIFIQNQELDTINLTLKEISNYLVNDRSILIARSGIPGSTRLIDDYTENTIYCGFIICFEVANKILKLPLFFSLKRIERFMNSQSGGTIMKNVNQGTLKTLKTLLPIEASTNKLVDNFNCKIEPIFKKINLINKENQQLTQLRDWLLPMLMNGQVSVK